MLFPYILGMGKYAYQDQMTSWPVLVDHCEFLVTFGGVSPRTAQTDSSGTTTHEVQSWMARATDAGMACVNISPLHSDMAGADCIAPRPGTDMALILAPAFEVFSTGHADRVFLARDTHGADVFETYVIGTSDGVPKTANWAAQICEIPAQSIHDLAARMASHRAMISMTWSM